MFVTKIPLVICCFNSEDLQGSIQISVCFYIKCLFICGIFACIKSVVKGVTCVSKLPNFLTLI